MSQVESRDVAMPCKNNLSRIVHPMLEQDPEVVSRNLTGRMRLLKSIKRRINAQTFGKNSLAGAKK